MIASINTRREMKMLTKLTPLIPLLTCLSLISDGVRAGASFDIFPEARDPVLGDRAALVEWAWSPQYAKRFGVPVQPDGLRDGPLWLVGVKILRVQSGATDRQMYQCRLAGLIDNKAAFLMPPGERYVVSPAHHWLGGLPGKVTWAPGELGLKPFTPAQTTWYKRPRNSLERERPERSITVPYLLFHHQYTQDLAFFEIETSCAYFGNPESLRSEVRFPTETFKPGDNGQTIGKAFESSALKIDIPDGLMRRIYPAILKAADWSACLMRRTRVKGYVVQRQTLERLGTRCDPVNPSQPPR